MGLTITLSPLILSFLFSLTAFGNPTLISDHISINCGGSSATSTAFTGRQWLGDTQYTNITLTGSSTGSTIINREPINALDPVPYKTARVSRAHFSYLFQLNPGQKFIRLLFNPTSYDGFESFNDLFTVEAGPFTLLANFSPSITARALAVSTVAKEFCLTVQENQPLSMVFSPATSDTYVFINGIEIISVPSSVDYCHGGDIGVHVVGDKSVIYINNSTALEMVHRQNIKRDYLSSHDDIRGTFGMWARISKHKAIKKDSNITWKVSVDVGFRYLIRFHFCEIGLKMAEIGHKEFILLINQMIATTGAEILQEREDEGILWYKNYMVMVNGHKREGKRDISIALRSEHEFFDGHGPLEGFEIFKLNNHDNSLANPYPLPTSWDSPSTTIQILLSFLGLRNAIATVTIAIVSLVNIIVHILLKSLGHEFTEEESKPSTRAKRLCRRFSLAEIQLATENFNDGFVIGRGGFGRVYKGRIYNGQQTVAIKRLKPNSKQGKREFWTEIESLSELRHVNLVPLIGYCNEQREMIIVYEYMLGGSLADYLYKTARKHNASSSLSWKQRLEICIGAGRGLDYLHMGHGFIHRDVKASNILLDEKFVAKVSDLGLAKIESRSELQSQASTNLKGTFGYIDPDYFKTHRITTKSDTYSFGVVLLEVLCGRPAVEPGVEEDKRSLTMWARDNINKGEVDQIVAPSLRGEILPDSLMTFVRIAERCLDDKPKKRPAMAHVVINLEFALEQQENAKSLVPNEITSVADFFPFCDGGQQDNADSLVPNEITDVTEPTPCTDKTLASVSTRQLTMPSSNMQNITSRLTEQIKSEMINAEKSIRRNTTMHKISRRLWPWNAFWKSGKSSKRKDVVGISLSAPMSRRTSITSRGGSAVSEKIVGGSNDLTTSPKLRIFSFPELKAATRNFRRDTVVGQGGFGTVYKGLLKNGSETMVAIKRLDPGSMQGFEEWHSEVHFLGKLSHPNLVKLLGYCWEDKELLLVYEFVLNGSLENRLFKRGSDIQPLSWDTRLKILIGAARGLAFLHASNSKLIYRDFKPSNILLDESYNAKLSDFGLAKLGPTAGNSHVTTQVLGTYGYAAPEYVATGHLYVKSDVYSFGVILVEMLTGLRALDRNRPSSQCNLVDWVKPHLSNWMKLRKVIDPCIKGTYPAGAALQIGRLALNCLKAEPKRRPSMNEVVETLEGLKPRVRFI